MTGANPETLAFLTEDRYDTTSADKVAAAAGLRPPPVETALRRWADRLVANDFGAAAPVLPGGFHEVAGSRTYLAGDRATPDFVLLPGPPFDGESWQALLRELDDRPALVPDLPGLGRSSPTTTTPSAWLTDLLAPARTRPVLVTHSTSATIALRCAATHPDHFSALVLISPHFLRTEHPRPPHAFTLKRTSPRPGVARRTARWLRAAHHPTELTTLRDLLTTTERVHIVTGNPPTGDVGLAKVTIVPGAGEHPHLTHPAAIADVLRRVADRG